MQNIGHAFLTATLYVSKIEEYLEASGVLWVGVHAHSVDELFLLKVNGQGRFGIVHHEEVFDVVVE